MTKSSAALALKGNQRRISPQGFLRHDVPSPEFRPSCPSRPAGRCIWAGLALTVLPASAQTAIRFTLDWRFEGPSALFLAALEKGYFKAEGLDVTIDTGNGSREAIPRVASGTYDKGFRRCELADPLPR